MLKLIKPEKSYLTSYYNACVETWGYVHDEYIMHNPKYYDNWKEHIFEDYENAENGINLPYGFLPNITYWLIDGEEYLGTINIRPKLSEQLKEYGGSLGIVIKKSARNKKIGTNALKLALDKLRELKISPIILTCEESNIASWHIVEHFHYKKREFYTTLINKKQVNARRYFF